MSGIRDLSGKRPVRQVDNLSKIIGFSSFVIEPAVSSYGFLIKATTKPILILGCDIRYFGASPNPITRLFGTTTEAVYDSAPTSTYLEEVHYTGVNPITTASNIKYGKFGYVYIDSPSGVQYTTLPEQRTVQGGVLIGKFQEQRGIYRTGGYLIQPGQVVFYGAGLYDSPSTLQPSFLGQMEGCLEYIEGDYDYSEFFRNGMQPFNY